MIKLPEHYVVEGELGSGGMGTVLRAHDLKHDRKVAIKVLRPDVARTFGTERFLREIRTAAGLVHPNIVTVFDSGEVDGTLYFVMPYIEGISLRDRLKKDGALSVSESVRIAQQIANALQFAHSHNLVHRDIKPENILLSNGHAWLVDFGVARATATTNDPRLTHTGLIVGSPLYMSPEQTREDPDLDGRSDIYSLACVLYEMLSGAPPFAAPTARGVMMRQLTDQPAPITATKSNVPAALDAVVRKALAKAPAERYRTAAEFETALVTAAGSSVEVPLTRAAKWKKWGIPALRIIGAIALAAVPFFLDVVRDWAGELPRALAMMSDRRGSPLDTTRYAVLPLSLSSDLAGLQPQQRIADALSTWTGIDVANPAQPSQSLETAPQNPRRYARELNAGRLVGGEITRKGDSIRVYFELSDGRRPEIKLNKYRHSYAYNTRRLDLIFKDIADSLLVRGMAPECIVGDPGTSSLMAIRACDHAFSAIQDGDLQSATREFRQALSLDAKYARAAVWLLEVNSWLGDGYSESTSLLASTTSSFNRLSPREQRIIAARRHLESGQFSSACDAFRGLIGRDSTDYVAWLGLGDCQRRDLHVAMSSMSPTGFAFRSSYHKAVLAYSRAFAVHPALLGAYSDRAFHRLREVLLTANTSARRGVARNGQEFLAMPHLDNDTLAFWPVSAQQFISSSTQSVPPTVAAALDRQRNLLRDLANRWTTTQPSSSGAHQALAIAYELDGNRAAINSAARARAEATNQTERLKTAAYDVMLRLKFGMPDNERELRRAYGIADSLLRYTRPSGSTDAAILLPVATLLGRTRAASSLSRQAATTIASRQQLPSGIVEPSRALLVFASMGGPVDSIREQEGALRRSIENAMAPARHNETYQLLATRASILAFDQYRFRSLQKISPGPVAVAQAAFARHDTAGALNALRSAEIVRSHVRPADLTIDVVFAETQLLRAIGLDSLATTWLDPTLNSTQWFPPGRLDDFVNVASLMRATLLRTELALQAGDSSTAKRWLLPARVFWSKGDPEQRAAIKRLEQRLNIPLNVR